MQAVMTAYIEASKFFGTTNIIKFITGRILNEIITDD
jgi:hypothetical protein